jgi:hypothetical protein
MLMLTVVYVPHLYFDLIAWCVIAAIPPLVSSYFRNRWRIPLWHVFVGMALFGLEFALAVDYISRAEDTYGMEDGALYLLEQLVWGVVCFGWPIFPVSVLIVLWFRSAPKTTEDVPKK